MMNKVLGILFCFTVLLSCKKDKPIVNDEYVQEPFVPQYYHLKGVMMDSVTGLPANGVFVTQILNGGGCHQQVEVVNGDFFLTYCTSMVTQPGNLGPLEVGHLGGSTRIALNDYLPVDAQNYYKSVWLYFTPVQPGDTAQVTVWTAVE